jgi:hypothetical protein
MQSERCVCTYSTSNRLTGQEIPWRYRTCKFITSTKAYHESIQWSSHPYIVSLEFSFSYYLPVYIWVSPNSLLSSGSSTKMLYEFLGFRCTLHFCPQQPSRYNHRNNNKLYRLCVKLLWWCMCGSLRPQHTQYCTLQYKYH